MTRADEAARYREAAHMTLDQLDWCVEYLWQLRKVELARQVAANAVAIRQRMDRPHPGTLTREHSG